MSFKLLLESFSNDSRFIHANLLNSNVNKTLFILCTRLKRGSPKNIMVNFHPVYYCWTMEQIQLPLAEYNMHKRFVDIWVELV